MMDEKNNKVLFAEAKKDFVDVLLSFLTLPLGTIARLVAKDSNIGAVKVGSLSTLYASVSNLEEEYLWTPTCKEMLLQPRNSMEDYCQQLKLNIDDTEPTKYFLCENANCYSKSSGSLLSTFKNQRCSCGNLMNKEMSPVKMTLENGFVYETADFIICDDMSVLPNGLITSVGLLRKLGIKYMDAIMERTVDISKSEVIDLLKFSLLSKTPLTSFIFGKKPGVVNFNPINRPLPETGEQSSDDDKKMVVKVLVRKSDTKILFAEADEDFADLLLSFLTLPLGGVMHVLEGCSCVSSIDKLYKSICELRSQALKEKLSNPKCAPLFSFGNQILPIGELCSPVYYCNTGCSHSNEFRIDLATKPRSPIGVKCYYNSFRLDIVDPKSFVGNSKGNGGFAKGPSMYMVTDDLVVTPISSVSGVSYLNRSKVSLFDVEEMVISIGVKEALTILKASLTSTSALTNSLKPFIQSVKRET
uniref:DUF674 family protein n=1 Tax=Cajanus cajan TaxID=3821 RepID=A0A151QQ79_CAJCA|nr:hypothetical protein KK1_046866 [Cajanus cajan]